VLPLIEVSNDVQILEGANEEPTHKLLSATFIAFREYKSNEAP